MLPPSLKEYAEELLSNSTGISVQIKGATTVGGGSINRTAKLQTTNGPYFLKYNSASLYPQMFELEKRGLDLLLQANEAHIPHVIGFGEKGDHSMLLLEYIESGLPNKSFWEDFGRALAKLHKHSAPKFGLDHNNYIGSLQQSNTEHVTWVDFFVSERLEPQLRLANLPADLVRRFGQLFSKLNEVFPTEPPSLLHGDLWNGNYMTASDGAVVLIDPAVYYGHREMDIGMSKLFGGFSASFYTAYNDVFPMEYGWEGRVDICNLYPLLVHVNLFGGSYLSQVTSILNKYTG